MSDHSERLARLRIDRVDLVDGGSNPEAYITFAKRDTLTRGAINMNLRKRSQVLEEVDARARELVDEYEDLSHDEAKGYVWELYPKLYDEYRASAPEPEQTPVQKRAVDPTLSDVITEAVHTRAQHLAWTQWPDRTEDQIRADVWLSDEGAALHGLAKSDLGQVPYWQARQVLRKNTAHEAAWKLLEAWRRG